MVSVCYRFAGTSFAFVNDFPAASPETDLNIEGFIKKCKYFVIFCNLPIDFQKGMGYNADMKEMSQAEAIPRRIRKEIRRAFTGGRHF